MVGERFGRLVVVGIEGSDKSGHRIFACECDCGGAKSILGTNLKRGQSKSCGCIQRELKVQRNTTHGQSSSPEHITWMHMNHRCRDMEDSRYGGRGITVCPDWADSFEVFLADMGTRPFPRAQIDRIDNNKGYSPDNCRWVDAATNCNNRRSNVNMTNGGITLTIKQWAIRCGVSPATFYDRKKRGWSDKRIIETPVGNNGRKKEVAL